MIYSASNVRWLLNLSHAFHWRGKKGRRRYSFYGLLAVSSRDSAYLTDRRVDLLFRLLAQKLCEGRRQDWNKFQFKLKFVFGSNAVRGCPQVSAIRLQLSYSFHCIRCDDATRWQRIYRPVSFINAPLSMHRRWPHAQHSQPVGIPRMSAIYRCPAEITHRPQCRQTANESEIFIR